MSGVKPLGQLAFPPAAGHKKMPTVYAGDREVADATGRGLFEVRQPGRFAAEPYCCGQVRAWSVGERLSCEPILAAAVDLMDQSGSGDVI
jgi:hypothetical protein